MFLLVDKRYLLWPSKSVLVVITEQAGTLKFSLIIFYTARVFLDTWRCFDIALFLQQFLLLLILLMIPRIYALK